MTGEEIQRNLVDFARKWSLYDGSERSEAQTFLNELFACYGTDRLDAGARFEEPQEGRFLDLLWPRKCIVEMKRPSEARRLEAHREQAFGYWRNAADPDRNIPAPRFVVICAFQRFEIWEPGAYPAEPRAEFELVELPDRMDALMFLAEREPVFVASQEAVTRQAVGLITNLFTQLGDRRAAGPDTLRDFLLQSVWCMFAEDLGQLESYLFTQIVEELIANPRRSSADDLGQLFAWLNRPGARPDGGMYASTRYVNGGLFQHPAEVHLTPDELLALRLACEYDWRKVEPHIFGSLLQGGAGAGGATRPWRSLHARGRHPEGRQAVHRRPMARPHRGRLNADPGPATPERTPELRDPRPCLRLRELPLRRGDKQSALSAFFPLTNIKGIEINKFAVDLARVTLWMAHKLSVDELDLDEATLPLDDLSGIRTGDALRVPWPEASVIIGNPPFHGDRNLRGLLGDDYVEWLKTEFNCGIKDHCVYWFRKTQDHLRPGQRAGLVGTNSISQNRARSASLNYVIDGGGVITDAVSTQPWPGEAVVEVSIVNWINEPGAPPTTFVLDERGVEGIDTALTESTIPLADVPLIPANRGRAFQGFLPGAKYDVAIADGEALLARSDAKYAEVVRPYLNGRDLTSTPRQEASRYVVDFGQMALEEAMKYPAALDVVRTQAKEARETSNSYERNPRWWQFLWPRPAFREAARGQTRFIAGTATGKRILFVWCEPHWRPSNATNMFALDTDYAMGVLTSTVHTDWAAKKSSTLRQDIRYTPSSAFETFPWPAADQAARDRIAKCSVAVVDLRTTLCAEHEIGLTTLYNRVDDGAFDALRKAHTALDLAVIDAYGWNVTLIDDLRARNQLLYALNAEIVRDPSGYQPF